MICGSGSPLRYAACYKTPSEYKYSHNWKFDPHKAVFCRKFSQLAPEFCTQAPNPCEIVHKALQSLDYFSTPPNYLRGGQWPTVPNKNIKRIDECSPYAYQSEFGDVPQLPKCFRPNPKPYGDALCGIRVPLQPLRNDDKNDGEYNGESNCDEKSELPFVVYPLWSNNCAQEKKVKKSGVERCMHPSNLRSFTTSNVSDFPDFYKTKSEDDLSYYRSPLAINVKRAQVCLDMNENPDEKILDGRSPIYLHAKMLKWNQKNKRIEPPSVSVTVPGPITIG